MAETRTTWAVLLAQFADNTAGAISAEDLRDFVASARPFVTTTAPTTAHDETLGFDVGHGWLDVTGPTIYVCVDASSAAAVWVQVFPASGGGASAFTDLADTPSSYAGQGGKLVAVNAGATALEFVTGGSTAWGDVTGALSDQTDLQAALDLKADSASLGTAALADTGDFATAAQGTKADSAVQPAAIATFVTGDGITDVVAVTQAAYDLLTPDAGTLYVITDA
ncbi:MAG: hypothetical protein WC972_03110 [Trueperaceae bacterium]